MTDTVQGSGIVGAAVTLSVATIGAGVLAIPATIQQGGIVFVLIVFSLVAVLTVLSIDYLVICIECLHLKSYEDIARELLGHICESAIRWILILYTLGIAAGYIVVLGDIVTPMIPYIQSYLPFSCSVTGVMIFCWALVLLPLSCIPHITKLRAVSMMAISAMLFVCFIVVYRFFVPSPGHRHADRAEIRYFSFSKQMFLSVPVMMFSFDCQSLVFQLYASLRVPSRKNVQFISTLSVGLAGSVYISVGLFGYLGNRPNVHGNILHNFDPLKDKLFAVGQLLYCVTISLAYVLVLIPSRDAVFTLLWGYNSITQVQEQRAIQGLDIVMVTTVLSGLSLFLALEAPGILFIVALLGSLCSSTLCFTYPAAFRLALHTRGIALCSQKEFLAAVVMLLVGIGAAVFGTFAAIMT